MDTSDNSPFHKGEQAIQNSLGVRERMERFGQKVIRDHMPDQHRAFYQRLPYVLVGHADKEGWPWASMLFGEAGFMFSSDAKALTIEALPVAGDPLAGNLVPGAKLGILGIELHTRRRNRLAVHVSSVSDNSVDLSIDQAFGNCPKYIQPRESKPKPALAAQKQSAYPFTELDDRAMNLIQRNDTFFVSSYIAQGTGQVSDGVDVSHRGGEPGFVRVDNRTSLTVPDYTGNFHFNTLGNFLENPVAGLLFVDFEKGHFLMLTGRVEILFESDDTAQFEGAQRLWTFQLDHGIWLNNALPLSWKLI